MAAIFEFPLPSELLSAEEIATITGCPRRTDQINWLKSNSWTYHTNRAGDPIVGRMYARLRLAGITPAAMTASGGWAPDFSSIQ